jgi:ABC-type antimicrobial peptide transport system permease subunit
MFQENENSIGIRKFGSSNSNFGDDKQLLLCHLKLAKIDGIQYSNHQSCTLSLTSPSDIHESWAHSMLKILQGIPWSILSGCACNAFQIKTLDDVVKFILSLPAHLSVRTSTSMCLSIYWADITVEWTILYEIDEFLLFKFH